MGLFVQIIMKGSAAVLPTSNGKNRDGFRSFVNFFCKRAKLTVWIHRIHCVLYLTGV